MNLKFKFMYVLIKSITSSTEVILMDINLKTGAMDDNYWF